MKIYQQKSIIAKLFILAVFTTQINAAPNPCVADFDDWIETGSCSKTVNKLCHGYYKQWLFSYVPPNTKQPITVSSDEASFVAKGDTIFKGKVVAAQSDKILFTDRAVVHHNEQTGDLESITAYGHVKIMQPGFRVDGTKAISLEKQDRKIIDNAVYRLYDWHARGQADKLVVLGRDKMFLTQSTYTTCAPGSNAWYIKASKTEFNKETGRGEAWNARLYMKDVPVFYWPYVNFPIDKRRQTGFLIPSIDNSSNNGFTVTTPFYWNIAPNFDSTITANYMTKRNFKFNTNFRYLTRSSDGIANFDFLPNDREYAFFRNGWLANPSFVNATTPPTVLQRNDLKNRNFRYRYALKHNTRFWRDFRFFIDYTDASDGNYLYDFFNEASSYATDKSSQLYALQAGGVQYFGLIGSLSYQLARYRTFYVTAGPTGNQQLSRLPAIDFNSATLRMPCHFNFLVNATYYQFRPRLIADNPNQLTYGHRAQARPALYYELREPGWFIIPRAQLNALAYTDLNLNAQDLQNGVRPNSSQANIPMYNVDAGLIFDRRAEIGQSTYLQTLEPRLYYLYVPYRKQNYLPQFDTGTMTFDYNMAFRDNIYTGLDRVNPANQFGYGLASKFYRNASGEEVGMVGVSQILYLRRNNFIVDATNNVIESNQLLSPIAFIAQAIIAPGYKMTAYLTQSKSYTENASVQMQYAPEPDRVINFGYTYVRDLSPSDVNPTQSSSLTQVAVSAAWQVYDAWVLLGKYSYDLRYKRNLDTIAGVEYHTCCTAIRAVWCKTWQVSQYHTTQHINSFKLQFIFRGLGGFQGVGSADDSFIKEKIPGYIPQH